MEVEASSNGSYDHFEVISDHVQHVGEDHKESVEEHGHEEDHHDHQENKLESDYKELYPETDSDVSINNVESNELNSVKTKLNAVDVDVKVEGDLNKSETNNIFIGHSIDKMCKKYLGRNYKMLLFLIFIELVIIGYLLYDMYFSNSSLSGMSGMPGMPGMSGMPGTFQQNPTPQQVASMLQTFTA